VTEAGPFALRAWESFYVIVGSSAGALTGLQFVVLTLTAEMGMAGREETISAFGSPNVVHFCAALLISAIFSAPWTTALSAGIAITVCGAFGVLYSLEVLRRTHRQRGYEPVLEDWIWHTFMPLFAYGSLLVAGFFVTRAPEAALFVVGGAALLLVFIGIRNAWDTVTYVVIERGRRLQASAGKSAAAAPPSAPASESPGDADPESP
jgi:hypothetical protein